MVADQRDAIVERLNALDPGPTEDQRRADREASVEQAIQTEDALKWGRLSAGLSGGIFGRSADDR